MTALRVHPLADLDIDRIAEYLAVEATEALALRFFEAVRAALDRLREFPEVGAPIEPQASRLHGIRSWPVPGFESHLVFYRFEADEVRVLRVLHGARDVSNILLVEPLDP